MQLDHSALRRAAGIRSTVGSRFSSDGLLEGPAARGAGGGGGGEEGLGGNGPAYVDGRAEGRVQEAEFLVLLQIAEQS